MFLTLTLIVCINMQLSAATVVYRNTDWCEDFSNFLSFEQVLFCKEHPREFSTMSKGGELALRHCKRVMRYERWLCADNKFAGDKRLYYYILNDGDLTGDKITKESAFLSAIRAAGMYYAIMAGYKQHLLPCPQQNRRNFGYCNTAAAKVVKDFLKLDILPVKIDSKLVTMHNSKLGMSVIFEFMRNYPERVHNEDHCCGTYPLPSFDIVAQSLYQTFVNNSYKASHEIDDDVLKLENDTVADPRWLLYFYESKDCPFPTWSDGKICYSGESEENTLAAEKQCKKYCCTNKCTKRVVEEHITEVCDMGRCCSETCVSTLKNVTNYYCC